MAISKSERLLNLVMCLMGTNRAVPREALRSVQGYPEATSDAAFQRMFERDKDELRAMGIPIETVTSASGEVIGYLIPRDDYRLPPAHVTTEQVLLLGLAARMWSRASLGRDAQTALRKIEAQAQGAFADPQPALNSRFHLDLQSGPSRGDEAIPIMWQAIGSRSAVSFEYAGLRDAVPHRRTIEPWGVLGRAGAWYVVGHDRERDDVRVFRTSRITSVPTLEPESGTYTIPEVSIADLVAAYAPTRGDSVATVRVRPGTGARLRLASTVVEQNQDANSAWDELHVRYDDPEAIAGQVAALGTDVQVIEPDVLRQVVVHRWQRVLEAHEPTIGSSSGHHEH
jgi:proteasome accessory factor B